MYLRTIKFNCLVLTVNAIVDLRSSFIGINLIDCTEFLTDSSVLQSSPFDNLTLNYFETLDDVNFGLLLKTLEKSTKCLKKVRLTSNIKITLNPALYLTAVAFYFSNKKLPLEDYEIVLVRLSHIFKFTKVVDVVKEQGEYSVKLRPSDLLKDVGMNKFEDLSVFKELKIYVGELKKMMKN